MQSRAELEAVPPSTVDDNVTVEMPSEAAQVGTASVPTYGLAHAHSSNQRCAF